MADHRIQTYTDAFEMVELTEESTDSSVILCPERGGIVTSFRSRGRELLYLDRETLLDPAANVRGGIPVLFPISGQLPGGEYVWEGQSYRIRNHGVVRNRPWRVVGTSTEDGAAVTIRIASDAGTQGEYPFTFELTFTYRLRNGALRIEQEYANLSERAMPFYAGLHPYFNAAIGPIAYETDATRLLDLNDGAEKPFSGTLDLSGAKESAVLLDAREPMISFAADEGARVALRYSPEFRYIVLWTVPGKPFICVEPWMAKNEEMLRGDELARLDPQSRLRLFVEISGESVR
ncbi:aldose epimerase [Gorillibacterium sp. sgz500922]|uniref:aldose epimerase family protein n=1 Tax=Gorillibacterium sp. sgz500922 TaxID=3446694 RepID=UPI003F67502B